VTEEQESPVVDAVDPVETLDPADASLLALVDRLGSLLERSELSELAVEAGGTRLVLRKPAAIAPLSKERRSSRLRPVKGRRRGWPASNSVPFGVLVPSGNGRID